MLASIFMLKKKSHLKEILNLLSLELLLEQVAVSTLLHCSLIW